MNYAICSFNVRGLGQNTKRRQIFYFLEKHNYDICLLQETHSKIEVESLWTRESKQHIFFSGRSSTSGDVCTLVKQSLKFKFIYHKEIIPGKIQALKLNIDARDIVFVNIYGPSRHFQLNPILIFEFDIGVRIFLSRDILRNNM